MLFSFRNLFLAAVAASAVLLQAPAAGAQEPASGGSSGTIRLKPIKVSSVPKPSGSGSSVNSGKGSVSTGSGKVSTAAAAPAPVVTPKITVSSGKSTPPAPQTKPAVALPSV
ncbi:MAG: hypothetical protein ACK48Y_12600, partial [Planctomyces sp.]